MLGDVRREDGLRIIAQLWEGKFPLAQKYFGNYLSRLVQAILIEEFDGRFVRAAFFPEKLENRLRSIEPLGQTAAILSEIGNIQDAHTLDARLLDALAELQTISQLHREGFIEINKVNAIADLTATRTHKAYAFQVKRINNVLRTHIDRRNEPDKRDSSPYGNVSDIYARLSSPANWFFRDTLEKKNVDFKKWSPDGWSRCIVVVSNDADLQDPLVRHIACQQIREAIHQLVKQNFEELLWLPDMGNGAWFTVGETLQDTRCFVDWCDDPDDTRQRCEERVDRMEVNLDQDVPS
jgi:dipeptidyl aminopeptidase/acylaminoacyl peptidase